MWIRVDIFLHFKGFILCFQKDCHFYIPRLFRGILGVIFIFDIFSPKNFRNIFSFYKFSLQINKWYQVIILIFYKHRWYSCFFSYTGIICTKSRSRMHYSRTVFCRYEISGNHTKCLFWIFSR